MSLFFSRWSKQKTLSRTQEEAPEERLITTGLSQHLDQTLAPSMEVAPEVPVEEPSILSMAQAEALPIGADVSEFLKEGVSQLVQKAALKKLFSDPAYNFISEMDDYVEDYSNMATMTIAEVKGLNQSKDLFLFEDPPWKIEDKKLAEQAKLDIKNNIQPEEPVSTKEETILPKDPVVSSNDPTITDDNTNLTKETPTDGETL